MNFNDPQTCQQLAELSHQFLHGMVYRLCKNHTLADEVIAPYLVPNYEKGSLKLNQLYEHFLLETQNKSTGGNAIRAVFGQDWSLRPDAGTTLVSEPDETTDPKKAEQEREDKRRWALLNELLCGFDPRFVRNEVKTLAALEKRLEPFVRDIKTEPPRDYLRSILQIGYFFGQDQFTDGAAVYDYFDEFYDEQNPAKLIDHLKQWSKTGNDDFFGMGEALLRDALKEIGYVGYVKPDVHINDIARQLGLIGASQKSTRSISIAVEGVATRAGITPYQLDKYWYLIGSGNFYHRGHHPYRQFKKADAVARKTNFVAFVQERIGTLLQPADKVALLVNGTDWRRGQVGQISAIHTQSIPQSKLVEVTFAGKWVTVYPTEFLVLHGEI